MKPWEPLAGVSRRSVGRQVLLEILVNNNWTLLPHFFVSVASKGFNCAVSLLFATLAGARISVADKGLRVRLRDGRNVGEGGTHPPFRQGFEKAEVAKWAPVSG